MNGLPDLQDLAHEGGAADPSRLRPVHAQGGLEHSPDAFLSGAQACAGSDGRGTEGMVHEARQGHLYDWRGRDVIAMEGGTFPRVSYIDPTWSWCSPPFHVSATELTQQPMVYFHGEVPK